MKLNKIQTCVILILYFIVFTFFFRILLEPVILRNFGMTGFLLSEGMACVLVMTVIGMTAWGWLKKQYEYFRKNIRENLKEAVKTAGKLYLLGIAFNMLVAVPMGLGNPENEAANMRFMQAVLPLFLFEACIFAPFTEEVVFRGCLCQTFGEKKYGRGVLLSAFVFGAMHSAGDLFSGNYLNLVYFIVYAGSGAILALPLKKRGTIFTGMTAHMIYNFVATLLSM